MFKDDGVICSALWSHARVDIRGGVTPCCRFNDTNFDKHPQLKNGLDNCINSEFFDNVRQRMLSGEKLKECKQCYDEESLGHPSMRTLLNERYSNHIETSPKIRYLELAFSSHCNLACRMCDETFSSKWKLINNPGIKVDTSIDANELSYFDDADLTELEAFKIVGGEPFMSKDHYDYLDKFIQKSDNPENIVIRYHTNGTVFPNDNIIEYWKKVKQVKLILSIDSIGRLNDYLRPGSSWETLTKNIERFKNIEGVDIELHSHSVISNLSIWKLIPLIKWKEQTFGDAGGFFVLTEPKHLSVSNMTDEYKSKAKEYISKLDEEHSWIRDMINIHLEIENDVVYDIDDIRKLEQKLDIYFEQDFNGIIK